MRCVGLQCGCGDGRAYCLRCEEEIDGLDEWAEREMRKPQVARATRPDAAEHFQRVGRFVRRWLWMPELAFVLGVAVYLGAAFSVALLRWMGAW